MLNLSTPFLHINPQDFPLHIFAGSDEDAEFAVQLPTSRWIPRIGETVILPLRNEEFNMDFRWGFIVKDVTYDFVDQVVEVHCDFFDEGQWSRDSLIPASVKKS